MIRLGNRRLSPGAWDEGGGELRIPPPANDLHVVLNGSTLGDFVRLGPCDRATDARRMFSEQLKPALSTINLQHPNAPQGYRIEPRVVFARGPQLMFILDAMNEACCQCLVDFPVAGQFPLLLHPMSLWETQQGVSALIVNVGATATDDCTLFADSVHFLTTQLADDDRGSINRGAPSFFRSLMERRFSLLTSSRLSDWQASNPAQDGAFAITATTENGQIAAGIVSRGHFGEPAYAVHTFGLVEDLEVDAIRSLGRKQEAILEIITHCVIQDLQRHRLISSRYEATYRLGRLRGREVIHRGKTELGVWLLLCASEFGQHAIVIDGMRDGALNIRSFGFLPTR